MICRHGQLFARTSRSVVWNDACTFIGLWLWRSRRRWRTLDLEFQRRDIIMWRLGSIRYQLKIFSKWRESLHVSLKRLGQDRYRNDRGRMATLSWRGCLVTYSTDRCGRRRKVRMLFRVPALTITGSRLFSGLVRRTRKTDRQWWGKKVPLPLFRTFAITESESGSKSSIVYKSGPLIWTRKTDHFGLCDGRTVDHADVTVESGGKTFAVFLADNR